MFKYDWGLLQRFLERKGNPPYKLIGNLDLSLSDVQSLGNLQHVEGDLNLESTPLSKKMTRKEIRSQVKVGGDIYF